ncbi:hypothetical protein BsWGS_20066 [Bradybaena similaris]
MSLKLSDTNLQDDPCAKELDLSKQCLTEKAPDQCQDILKNLQHCRHFWSWVESQRKKEGINPAMPAPQDREQVKQKYLPLMTPPGGRSRSSI